MSGHFCSEDYFRELTRVVGQGLHKNETLCFELQGESSQFLRLNEAKVRQIGEVEDCLLTMTLTIQEGDTLKEGKRALSLKGSVDDDLSRSTTALEALRKEVPELPPDPFTQIPEGGESSCQRVKGNLLPPEEAVEALVPPIHNLKLTGIYSSGTILRASANSLGPFHWFETDSFIFDYSLYTKEYRAIKRTWFGQNWDSKAYLEEIESAKERLPFLERPAKKVARGSYRVYLAPAALSDIVNLLSWNGIGESFLRKGDSPLLKLRMGEVQLSPQFNLREDFSLGATPRFNERGELAPKTLSLISGGKLANALVNSRTAKEYGLPSNGANSAEALRSPVVACGTLSSKDILKELGTGLYLSNVHYLNWSDRLSARLTGMTRYACFWVENGEVQAPIENLRFDESLFNLFGTELSALTDFQNVIPVVWTYEFRQVGASQMPGILVSKMAFTL